MPSSRLCLGCGRRTKSGSYCAACAKKRAAQRQRENPWVRLYHEPEWQTAKWNVHRRDEYRCTFLDARGRCTATSRNTRLEAHHLRKLRDLWQDAGRSWQAFLPLALDQANIVTLCYRHHMKADYPGRPSPARLSARPLPRRP